MPRRITIPAKREVWLLTLTPSDTIDASTYHYACEKGGVVANALRVTHPGTNCLHLNEVWARGSPVGKFKRTFCLTLVFGRCGNSGVGGPTEKFKRIILGVEDMYTQCQNIYIFQRNTTCVFGTT